MNGSSGFLAIAGKGDRPRRAELTGDILQGIAAVGIALAGGYSLIRRTSEQYKELVE